MLLIPNGGRSLLVIDEDITCDINFRKATDSVFAEEVYSLFSGIHIHVCVTEHSVYSAAATPQVNLLFVLSAQENGDK